MHHKLELHKYHDLLDVNLRIHSLRGTLCSLQAAELLLVTAYSESGDSQVSLRSLGPSQYCANVTGTKKALRLQCLRVSLAVGLATVTEKAAEALAGISRTFMQTSFGHGPAQTARSSEGPTDTGWQSG